MTQELRLDLERSDGSLAVATVTGELSLHTAPDLHTGASKWIRQGHHHLILDLQHVGFCDSSGLSALIRIWHSAKEADGTLTLAAVPDRLMRMLNLTGLDSLLIVHPTVHHALSTHRPTADA
ncbi:STAS domain-containing protein [Streptomyces sp. KN37]|uniref:STAS domain-containing protein n=1 Tax=Streptomyces sp. KN37 TaxID=3090667 RepID=UPI002A764AF5|nr:STAS domain-containing protein [Streptomyces sp. KN37]WPO69739.1 STAS domain-containing protein [Streptomyces sp. KN37]